MVLFLSVAMRAIVSSNFPNSCFVPGISEILETVFKSIPALKQEESSGDVKIIGLRRYDLFVSISFSKSFQSFKDCESKKLALLQFIVANMTLSSFISSIL